MSTAASNYSEFLTWHSSKVFVTKSPAKQFHNTTCCCGNSSVKEKEQHTAAEACRRLQAAKSKAGILKPGSIHSLGHSFATHLVDRGTDISMIQKLLGHDSIKTTLRYVHTSNKDLLKIVSLLDDLKLTP